MPKSTINSGKTGVQTAVTRCFTNLCLLFSSKETPLRVLRPRQADVKSTLISPRPQARPRLPLRGRCQRFALTEGLVAQASCGVIPSQCSHWRGNPFPAPAGAASPLSLRGRCQRSALTERLSLTGGAEPRPYTPSDVPCERPLPLPLGEVAERSEDGEGKP